MTTTKSEKKCYTKAHHLESKDHSEKILKASKQEKKQNKKLVSEWLCWLPEKNEENVLKILEEKYFSLGQKSSQCKGRIKIFSAISETKMEKQT